MVFKGNKVSRVPRGVQGKLLSRLTSTKSGWSLLHDSTKNKGLGFTEQERDKLGLRGLIPARVLSEQDQLDWCVSNVQKMQDGLQKYMFLRDLQDSNERLFYRCLVERMDIMLPIVYTPIVGLACQNYGFIYRRPRGMFISIQDKGRIEDILKNWPIKDVRAIVVTDGERILGLGDLGANGMGIPVGKMAIYTAMGGISPQQCLPVTLDVGTNNRDLLECGAQYLGLRRPRVTGKEYYQLVDEFMKAVVKVFGRHTLIQFEDFANENAFKFLRLYRHEYTMFNDDIQGTAAVVLAGLLAAERFAGKKISNSKILFAGAGEAGIGIANLIVSAMGGDPDQARKRIYMKRSKKLLVKEDESQYDASDDRRLYCHEVPEGADVTDLVKIIKWLKPDTLIGVSATGKLFTQEVLETMAEVSDSPIILPLSNPTDKSECSAEDAYKFTKGKCLFASGSPFPPVTVNGVLRQPYQCNNAYIFPGVALATITAKMSTVPDEVFLIAARTLAKECLQKADFDTGSLYPPLSRMVTYSVDIAAKIVEYAFDNNLANLKSRPADIKAYIWSHHYNSDLHHHHHNNTHHPHH